MQYLSKEVRKKVYEAINKNLKFNEDLFQDILFKEAEKGKIDYRFSLEISGDNNYNLDGQLLKDSLSETVYNLHVNNIDLFVNYLTLEGFIVYEEEDHIVISLNNLTMALI